MTTLAQMLTAKRKKDGASLREAAEKIGISHGYLDKLEKGVDKRTGVKNNPTPETLGMIAKAYEWDYNYLLQICGYITDKNTDALSPCLQELIQTCHPLSESDVQYVTRFARFVLAENFAHYEKNKS